MQRLARQDTERREHKPKPTVDEHILERGRKVWERFVGMYGKRGRAVSRRERLETAEEGEDLDPSLTYSATPHEVIASAILRIRSYYGNPDITSVGEIRDGEGILQENVNGADEGNESEEGKGESKEENEPPNEPPKDEEKGPESNNPAAFSAKLGKGGIFFDLGSGVGGVVCAAASVHCWDELVGIECLEGLHNTSQEVQNMWEKTEVTNALGTEYERGAKEGLNKIRFLRSNIFELDNCDWTVGDVVFCNCVMFTEEKMKELQAAALGMRPGTFLLTVTRPLATKDGDFELVEERTVKMDYGDATVFMWVRVADDESMGGGRSLVADEEDEGEC